MPRYEKSLKEEKIRGTREDQLARQERLMREAAELTGFDVLIENKEKGLSAMRDLLASEPSLTRKQLSEKLNFSMRTIYRYLRIIREGRQITTTAVDDLIAEKAQRVAKLVRLMNTYPEYTRTQLAEKIGVSRKTLYSYLNEIGL